jgi:uncharacterized protein (DUF2062 family)
MILKKIKTVIIGQLLVGVTPDKLTQSLSLGLLIGINPFLGTATALCFLTATIFKLNHVAIQTTHYVIYPLQIIMVPVYIKIVSLLFEVGKVDLRPDLVIKQFYASPALFMKQYGVIGMYAFVLWILVSIPSYFLIYRAIFPLVVRIRNRKNKEALHSVLPNEKS